MKTPLDPRHKRRQRIVEDLFRNQFHNQRLSADAQKIVASMDAVDAQIQKAAPEFPIDKINRIDLAILRLAVFELSVEKKEPPQGNN